ncbi:hypothetical protein EES37_25970 [Streptomyces sp. ADI91-18]|nr:hypothetical protein EES37_25970 [Streptomyces sp. ADI91-18]
MPPPAASRRTGQPVYRGAAAPPRHLRNSGSHRGMPGFASLLNPLLSGHESTGPSRDRDCAPTQPRYGPGETTGKGKTFFPPQPGCTPRKVAGKGKPFSSRKMHQGAARSGFTASRAPECAEPNEWCSLHSSSPRPHSECLLLISAGDVPRLRVDKGSFRNAAPALSHALRAPPHATRAKAHHLLSRSSEREPHHGQFDHHRDLGTGSIRLRPGGHLHRHRPAGTRRRPRPDRQRRVRRRRRVRDNGAARHERPGTVRDQRSGGRSPRGGGQLLGRRRV